MLQKIHWRNFWKNSSVLISHTLLACFYLKVALVLFEYYRHPVLAAGFLAVSMLYAIPLIINFVDLWALTMAAANEEAFAENMLKMSMATHAKLFGARNILMLQKQSMLAGLNFQMGRTAEAEELFREAWEKYKSHKIKLPWIAASFADYQKLLATRSDTATTLKVQEALKNSSRMMLAANLVVLLATGAIVVFLLYNQAAERSIALFNSRGQIDHAMSELEKLASNEALILGSYAAARVYTDYARAFDGSVGRSTEMERCTDKAMAYLNQSRQKDEYLRVVLLNLKAKAELKQGNTDESMNCLKEAVALSSGWTKNQLFRNKLDAALQRERAIIALGELDRIAGRYEQAEALYRGIIYAEPGSPTNSKITSVDLIEDIDRLHKFQHVEQKLGKKEEVLKIQERICKMVEDNLHLWTGKKNAAVCSFGAREAARELDNCALMLQESGRDKEARVFLARADALRKANIKPLQLNASQQDSIVDAATKLTNDLLSVKYRAVGWPQALNHLLNDELKSTRARDAFERLPWYDAGGMNGKKITPGDKTLCVDISPVSVKNAREGDGIAVDVQGTVKIVDSKSKSEDEQTFCFAYMLKSQSTGHHTVEDLSDVQALAQIHFD